MRRREFIAGLGSAAAWPAVVWAQQPALPVIGYVSASSHADFVNYVAAFHRGLVETGFIEGRNVAVEYRFAEGHLDRSPALVAVNRGATITVQPSAKANGGGRLLGR